MRMMMTSHSDMSKEENKRVEAYKNELKNIWFYQEEETRLQSLIDDILYEMENVKGVDYSKQVGSNNPSAAENKKLKLIEVYNKYLKKKKEIVDKEKSVCRVLNRMKKEERDLVIDVVTGNKKYREICEEKNISSSSLFNQINNIILEAIKKAD